MCIGGLRSNAAALPHVSPVLRCYEWRELRLAMRQAENCLMLLLSLLVALSIVAVVFARSTVVVVSVIAVAQR